MALKQALKKWNIEVFGNMDFKLKQAEESLHALDLIAENRDLDEVEGRRRREVRGDMWKFRKMIEKIWLQKSRLNCKVKGDKNIKFFHIIAKKRQNTNAIDSMIVNGTSVKEPVEMKQAMYDHFRTSFNELWRCRPKLLGPFKVIEHSQFYNRIKVDFSETKIWAAITKCNGSKALGPDDFNMTCYQKEWSSMKGDILNFLKEFYVNNKLVLANKLKRLLPAVIGNAQYAFLGGRNILDGVLIANEVVDWWKKSRRKGLILKLDFQKAYDTVNWNFLLQMLSNFVFGLRQGDPLSHFLFNVVAEGLNLLLARAKELGLVKGVIIGSSNINISHLQFADDTIIFCEAEWTEVLNFTYQKLQLKYLGMKLGANPSRRATGKPVVEKFKKKLIGWKRRLPRSVAKEIDKIQVAFLWGDSAVKRKVHLVKWKDLTKDKKHGGLGIRNL
ncbi:uncharacterized protein LOC114282492 [Camellia sinensis]|uniref:uncharacterized protein LOC114282492 n=1 Tax=Camellia sinensis TaxID=4442 RepID=UPI0010358C3C|nr:uncharacterized protein LOC114282492 [Camellia sinensis]